MKPASLNHTYRLVWNEATLSFTAVAETARARGKGHGRRVIKCLAAVFGLAVFSGAFSAQLPIGGQVVAGSGSISQSGNVMTVTQTSDRMVANWHSFSIGQGHAVNFAQPSASSVAFNRVLGSDVSVIRGALNANGQVFLVNPNGVLFSPGAQVNVGGLVASTLDISTADFMAGNYNFSGSSRAAITIHGNIAAATGGTVALIAARIINKGSITAPQGQILMGAGQAVTLDLGGPVKLQVTQGALHALIEQGGAIRADGGLVYLTARAAGDLATAVINHTGISEARTLATGEKGEILLLADMQRGTVRVGGTLDASAPQGGNGGFVETSAAHVQVADSARITTAAPNGNSGTWLIDPQDFTIAANGGDITGAALSANLGAGNVVIQSTNGTTAGNGDIFVNDTVSWSANDLTLTAYRNININANLNGSGTASLAFEYGQGAVNAGNTANYAIANGIKINLPSGNHFSTKLGSDGATVNYTVITGLGAAGSNTAADLQGINGNLAGNYVLGADIDASATSGWNGGAGFAPTGSFSGRFDGLGHTISNLTVNRPGTDFVGLFGNAAAANIANVALTGVNITGRDFVGGLVGRHMGIYGAISNVSVSGSVAGRNKVGGLVGWNNNVISNANTSATVSASGDNVGGLVGESYNTISNAWANGNVSGSHYTVGGLIGYNTGNLLNVHATGNVAGVAYVGGLAGAINQNPTIDNAYATGNVTGAAGGDYIGGLVGSLVVGTINNSWASGSVSGGRDYMGGLVGQNGYLSTVSNSHATGNVFGGRYYIGGLVGGNNSYWAPVSNSYATGSVSGVDSVGGLVGVNNGSISASYATGSVSASANSVGGLVGWNAADYLGNPASIIDAYATGNVSGPSNTGGLVGYNGVGSTITNAYATGRVVGAAASVNGLIGSNDGTVSASYWDMATSGRNTGCGGISTGCQGFNTADMKALTTYILWDIDDTGSTGRVWRIYNGDTTPLLRAFLTPLTVTSVSDGSKVYDGITGTNLPTYTASASHDASRLVAGGSAQDDKNVGNYTIRLASIQQGYDLSGTRSAAFDINPRPINLSGSRAYDGSVDVAPGIFTLGNLVAAETLNIVGTGGSVADRNVGTGKAVTLGSLGLSNGTGLSANYTLSGGTHVATITPKALTISGITAANKVYDGTTAAALDTSGVMLSGLVGGDVLTVSASGTFVDKHADTGKTVSISSSYGGADINNYAVTDQSTTTADIAARAVTVTADANSKNTGQGDPVLTYATGCGFASAPCGLITGETLSGGLIRDAGETSGVFAIRQGTLDDLHNPDYQISYVGADFAIAAVNGGVQSTEQSAAIATAQQDAAVPRVRAPNPERVRDEGVAHVAVVDGGIKLPTTARDNVEQDALEERTP